MILKTLKILAISIYVVCGGLLLIFAIPRVGWKALDVATGSMTPAIPQGSLVFIHAVRPSNIKVGNVVTYINPADTKQTITHRVVKVTTKLNLPAFITKGDANSVSDPEILGGNIVGKVEWHLPYLGTLIGYARKPLGLIILVIIPGVLIVIDELRRLADVFSETENQIHTAHGGKTVTAIEQDIPEHALIEDDDVGNKSTGRIIDLREKGSKSTRPIKPLMLIGFVLVIGFKSTFALLNTSVTLTGNTISTVILSNHIDISLVAIGGESAPECPELGTVNVTIIDSGAGSKTSVIDSSECHETITEHDGVTVVNNVSNSSKSGPINVNGNTSTGDFSTGNASSTSSTTTTVDFKPDSSTTQWFELYNPTSAPVPISGWSIEDNSGTPQLLPALSIPPKGFVIIPAGVLSGGKIGNGLSGANDQLTLLNLKKQVIDSISWGADTLILNPAIPAIPSGDAIQRINPNYDSNTASDWEVIGL
ncbi:MAG: signal peptidase I [Candidatus Saccharimonadia bacterium]